MLNVARWRLLRPDLAATAAGSPGLFLPAAHGVYASMFVSQLDEFVAIMRAQVGVLRYDTGTTRTTWTDGYTDCSGLQIGALHRTHPPVATPAPSMSSFTIAQWCHQAGTGISKAAAVGTFGAWAIKGANEGQTSGGAPNGSDGHIACMLGVRDGFGNWLMVEARGHRWGVVISPWRDEFSYYAKVPPLVGQYGARPAPTGGGAGGGTAMPGGELAGNRVQTGGPYKGRFPEIVAVEQPDGTTDLVGMNGAQIAGGIPFLGMSVFKLGRLNRPITAVRYAGGGTFVACGAADGGTFAVQAHAVYG